MSSSFDPLGCRLPGSFVRGIFQARILKWVVHLLLQGTFLTQSLNPGLLHCRQILYWLSHQGSPLRRESDCRVSPTSRDLENQARWSGLLLGALGSHRRVLRSDKLNVACCKTALPAGRRWQEVSGHMSTEADMGTRVRKTRPGSSQWPSLVNCFRLCCCCC